MSIHSKESQSTPNLEDIRQENDGGVIAISGFDYQFHFAAQKCLEMLAEPDKYEFVSSETHEDVVVQLKNGPFQFYQVKQKDNEQWNLSQLKSRNVWRNFIKVREQFGSNNSFWFVSEQTATFSTKSGKDNRIPDLGQMKRLTNLGINICKQNIKDQSNVDILLARLDKDWNFNNPTETKSFFWNIRILTDHEHETGLESRNIRRLQEILENRGINADTSNLSRIYELIIGLLRKRVRPSATATYEETIEIRKIRPPDLEACISGPFVNPNLNHFLLDGIYEEPQRRDLREKTQVLNPRMAEYFIDSRNYFAVLCRQQVSYTISYTYIARLRQAVWGVCQRHKVFANKGDKPIQTYRSILEGLTNLAETEQNKQPPFEVTFDYLHGMMCQLTAECRHDWHPLTDIL